MSELLLPDEPLAPGAAAEAGLMAYLTAQLDADQMGRIVFGLGPRFFAAWPKDLTDRNDFPRVTIRCLDVPVIPGVYHQVRASLHMFAWSSGDNGRRNKLFRMDAWLLRVLNRVRWHHEGCHLEATVLSNEPVDRPGDVGGAASRTRFFRIDAALLS